MSTDTRQDQVTVDYGDLSALLEDWAISLRTRGRHRPV
jgi:hypothetical protein